MKDGCFKGETAVFLYFVIITPLFMRWIWLIGIAAVIGVPARHVSAEGPSSSWTDLAVAFSNAERETRGIPMLTVDDTLVRAAGKKLDDMERGHYFAHTSPEGATPWSFFDEVGYEYRFAGENLAIHFLDPEAEHDAWMRSEKHCQNILDARFRDVGMAARKVFMEGRETILVVQMFGTRLGDEESVDTSGKESAVSMCGGTVRPVSTVPGADVPHGGIVSSVSDAMMKSFVGSFVSERSKEADLGQYGRVELSVLSFLILLQIVGVSIAFRFRTVFGGHEWREGTFGP